MITTGLALAGLTGTAFYLIYKKLPRKIRNFMKKHVLLTDGIACLLTYMLFGGTLVALFAAAWLGLIISIMLALLNNEKIEAALGRFTQKLFILKDKLITYIETLADKQEPAQLKEAA